MPDYRRPDLTRLGPDEITRVMNESVKAYRDMGELVSWRNMLMYQVISLYCAQPDAIDEMKRLASGIVKNKEVVDRMAKSAQEMVDKRKQQ